MKTYRHKFLWRVGFYTTILIFIAPCLLIIAAIQFNELFEFELEILNNDWLLLKLSLLLIFLVLFQYWYAHRWKKWALNKVRPEEEHGLVSKIMNKKESFVSPPWNERSTGNKLIRILIALSIISVALYFDQKRKSELTYFYNNAIETEAEIVSLNKTYKRKKMRYSVDYKYTVDSTEFRGSKILDQGWLISNKAINGFSPIGGDRFLCRFDQNDPIESRLDLRRPLAKTLNKYLALSRNSLSEIINDSSLCHCIVDSLYKEFGIDAIACIANKNESYWDNSKYNSIKFKMLLKSDEYGRIIKNCALSKSDSSACNEIKPTFNLEKIKKP